MTMEFFYNAAKVAWFFSKAELEELVREFDLGHLKLALKIKNESKHKRWGR